MASEIDPLLPRARGAKVTRYGGSSSRGGPGSHTVPRASPCASCCGAPRSIHYSDISDDCASQVRSLMDDLNASAASPASSDARVCDALERLWNAVAAEACEDDVIFPFAAPRLPSREWRRLGFQSDDPTSDMRGGGLAAVTYVARACAEYRECRELGVIADREMPLAIASINVLYMLRCHLMLFATPPAFCPCCATRVREEYGRGQPHGGGHIIGFAALLSEDPDAFFHVYATTLILAGCIWRRRFGVAASAVSSVTGAVKEAQSEGRRSRTRTQASDATASAGVHSINAHPRDSFTVVTRTTGSSSSRPTAPVDGDARLLEWPAVLTDTKTLILQALAEMPPDIASLRALLLSHLRSRGGDIGMDASADAALMPRAIMSPSSRDLDAFNGPDAWGSFLRSP